MATENTGPRPHVLGLIHELAIALSEAEVSYCHWKSNEALSRSLVADNDLDLLVERDHFGKFLEVVLGLGFRLAFPPSKRQVPGQLSLYGLDRESGRLVQIDAQSRLVVGDDMTKNYRIAIEGPYLESVDRSTPLPTPRPELEYLMFVLRMVLKHCPWDAQLSYKARLTASEQRELAYLEARVDGDEVQRLRAQHLAFIPADLFDRCRQAVGRDLGAVTRNSVARRLTRALEGCERRSPRADTALKLFRRLTGRLQRRFLPGMNGKRPAAGGMVIAIVGGDGSGKTSAVDDVESFLGRHFITRRFHLGKPPPDLFSRLARAAVRRIPAHGPPSGLPPWKTAELVEFPGYSYLLIHLLTARDRYRAHRAARRAASKGAIAVCDRYPLPGLETMDSPRLQDLPGMHRPLAGWMRNMEADYYRRLRPPDLILVLKVAPDVAVSRRVDQDQEFVRRRATEIYERQWKEPNEFVLDSGRPMEQVQQDLRALVWSLL